MKLRSLLPDFDEVCFDEISNYNLIRITVIIIANTEK